MDGMTPGKRKGRFFYLTDKQEVVHFHVSLRGGGVYRDLARALVWLGFPGHSMYQDLPTGGVWAPLNL